MFTVFRLFILVSVLWVSLIFPYEVYSDIRMNDSGDAFRVAQILDPDKEDIFRIEAMNFIYYSNLNKASGWLSPVTISNPSRSVISYPVPIMNNLGIQAVCWISRDENQIQYVEAAVYHPTTGWANEIISEPTETVIGGLKLLINKEGFIMTLWESIDPKTQETYLRENEYQDRAWVGPKTIKNIT